MSNTLELINAIASGDASGTENAFQAAMAEKIGAKLDDMRISVAQSMFTPVAEESVEINQEQYEALSEEEKDQYESKEQLDELSKVTLSSYVKKATVSNRNAAASHANAWRDGGNTSASAKTMDKREKGISGAVDRMSN